jgi:iron complex outermembrane receptor protein
MKKFLLVFAVLCIYTTIYSQGILKGVVKDLQTGQPVPGASIKINNTQESAVTDDNGTFELKYSSDFKIITVKAIGYSKQEVSVSDKSKELTVALDPTNLSTGEIQVEGFLNKKKNIETPESIGFLSKEDLNRDIGVNIQNTMNLIPGVRMEFRNLGSGVLLTIRGYGHETNFNGNGFKAYYNDISLTDADGTTALDEVDYTNLSSVEVFKGPASSIYGSNIGGVLSMKTAKAPWGTNVILGGLGGSYGLLRTNTGVTVGNGKLSLFANYGHQQYTGFRDHNNSKENFALINGSVYMDTKNTLSFFGNYSNVYNALAGEQDSATYINNPSWADTMYVKNDAHIQTESTRLGFSYEHMFSRTFANKTSLYGGFFVLDQPFAVGLSRANRSKLGARTTFSYSPVIGKVKTNFTFGGEFLENVIYAKSYGLFNNVLGALRGDQEIKPMMYNVFGQADVNITKSTLLTAGTSVNFVEYTVTDMVAADTSHAHPHVNASGYKRFSPIITPRVAINQVIKGMFSLYASVSTGFTPPSTGQVLITQLGQVNLDLKPETAVSFEFGSKGELLKKALNYELAIYQMDVKDKLVSQSFPAVGMTPAYSITTNAGKVRYRGVEAKISYAYVPEKPKFISLVRPFVTYTYTSDKYVDFKSDNNNNANTKDYSGLKVVGVAPNVINAGLDVETKPGVYVNLTYSYNDKIPLSFDNAHFAEAYGLLNSRLGVRRLLGKKFNLEVYGGADNITGQRYPTELFLNPFDKHFYLAGPNKATFYGGLSLSYNVN